MCNCYDELILRWVFLWVPGTLSTSSCLFRVSVLMYFLHRKILMSVNFVSSTDKSCNRSETLSRSIQILAKLSTCTSHRSENFPDLLTIVNRFKKTLKWLKNAERNAYCLFLLIYWITIYIKEMMIKQVLITLVWFVGQPSSPHPKWSTAGKCPQ